MAYIALKPCSFAGQKFKIGEEVPRELVINAKNHIKMGTLADPNFKPSAEKVVEVKTVEKVGILVAAGDETLSLGVTPEGLQSIFGVLTSNAETAEPIVKEMTDGDALILLHITDKRKTIQAAAEARAAELEAKGQDEGEQ